MSTQNLLDFVSRCKSALTTFNNCKFSTNEGLEYLELVEQYLQLTQLSTPKELKLIEAVFNQVTNYFEARNTSLLTVAVPSSINSLELISNDSVGIIQPSLARSLPIVLSTKQEVTDRVIEFIVNELGGGATSNMLNEVFEKNCIAINHDLIGTAKSQKEYLSKCLSRLASGCDSRITLGAFYIPANVRKQYCKTFYATRDYSDYASLIPKDTIEEEEETPAELELEDRQRQIYVDVDLERRMLYFGTSFTTAKVSLPVADKEGVTLGYKFEDFYIKNFMQFLMTVYPNQGTLQQTTSCIVHSSAALNTAMAEEGYEWVFNKELNCLTIKVVH